MTWRHRIVELVWLPPEDLMAHPMNARFHPNRQRAVMRQALDDVGWISPVIENVTTGHLLDGHLRVEEALSAGIRKIPVVRVAISAEEEAEALVTHDAVGQLARWEKDRLDDLIATLDCDPTIGDLVEDIADLAITLEPGMPEDLGSDDEILGEMRSVCAVYPAERYREVLEDLDRVPGASLGQKLDWLLARHAGYTVRP